MKKIDLKKLKMVERKAGNTIHVTAIDAVLGELDVIESRNNKDASEEQVMATLKTTISQSHAVAATYIEADREKTAEGYTAQGNYLESLLPKQLTEDEMKDAADDIISSIDVTDKGAMGKVIGQLKGKHGATLDMAFLSTYIKDTLSTLKS